MLDRLNWNIINKKLCFILLLLFGVVLYLIFNFWNWDNNVGVELLESDHKWTNSSLERNKLFGLDFKYLLNAHCSETYSLAVIIVTSHLNNVETRSAMRRSFSQSDLDRFNIRRVFLLGQSNDSPISQSAVVHESQRFGDIVQGNFFEAYRNLTYKHVMGLKWASDNCISSKYVIKMDDDIVLNVHKVIALLMHLSLPLNSIGGFVFRDMKTIREPANKWFVTKSEYQFSTYPNFVSGWFYITTPKIASRLTLVSHYFKYFWIDDVYITGILAKSLKLKLFDLRKYFTVYSEFLQCCINDAKKLIDCDILVGPNGGDNNLFFTFNKVMQKCEGVCHQRVKPLNETCVAEKKLFLRGGSGFIENYKLH